MFGDNRPPSGHHQGWVGVPLRMDTSLRHSCQCVSVYTCACKRMHVFSVHVLLPFSGASSDTAARASSVQRDLGLLHEDCQT